MRTDFGERQIRNLSLVVVSLLGRVEVSLQLHRRTEGSVRRRGLL